MNHHSAAVGLQLMAVQLALSLLMVFLGCTAALADRASDVADLEARCEAERETRIKPLRDAEIARCKVDSRNDPAYCERYWKDYGSARRGANGGTIPRMFDDLPVCVEAFAARRALADGDRH
jgi:hypothetical protein